MSWNKNTINNSEIDKTIELLKEFKIKYTLKTIGKVPGYGLNDYYNDIKDYKIRQLEYNDFIIVEQMNRHPDCDMNDVILSFKFKKDKVPKKWEIEK